MTKAIYNTLEERKYTNLVQLQPIKADGTDMKNYCVFKILSYNHRLLFVRLPCVYMLASSLDCCESVYI